MVDSCGILAVKNPLCYASNVMNWLRTLSLAASVAVVGCQNNTVTLETDPEPLTSDGDGTASTGGDDDMDVGTITDPTTDDTTAGPGSPQTLLFALSTPLEPGLPFQALVTTTPGNGTVDLSIQWLALDPGSTTTPREPVGDVYSYPALPVDGTGTFYWDTGVILLPGRANPVTGEDLVLSVQANVVPVGSPAYCGDAGGTVLQPFEFPLDGSTHAMTAVDPVNLPLDFAISCP